MGSQRVRLPDPNKKWCVCKPIFKMRYAWREEAWIDRYPEERMSEDLTELVNRIGHSRPTHVVVAEAIRRQITLGRLQPGDQLPTERKLSQQLGIGRTTLRKAIKSLVDEGAVGTKLGRGGGSVVLSADGSPEEILLAFDQCQSAIEHTYEARLALEPTAAELAASRATEDQIQTLFENLRIPAPTVNSYHSLDSRLHTRVAEASGNPLLLDAIENARVGFFRWANALWINADWQKMRAGGGDAEWVLETDHRQIVEAISARDPEGARSAMVEHLKNGREQYREVLERIFPPEA